MTSLWRAGELKALIGYSRCRITQAALEAKGVEAWTCDLLPADHHRHFQCDVWEVLEGPWDFAILHPMCTYLTVSAAWAFNDPDFVKYPGVGYHQKVKAGTLTGHWRREARQAELENFRKLEALPYPKAIENPATSFLNKAIRPPDQVVHPYMFGDDASKGTGLWLDRLPALIVPPKEVWVAPRLVDGKPRWSNQTDSGQNRVSPSDDRWLERSTTYPGIAIAFGQWGDNENRA